MSTGMPRLPLIVRTAADMQLLLANARAIRRLPRHGVQVAIAGLEPCQAHRLRTRLGAYIGACGCAEGGAAALIGMLGVLVWIAIQMTARGPQLSDLGTAAAGGLLAVVLGGLGKLLGVTITRLRFERCCIKVLRTINKH
jgi:hypothetical protein